MFLIMLAGRSVHAQQKPENQNETWLTRSIEVSRQQLLLASKYYAPGMNPRSVWPNGELRYATPRDWTSGFFPGSLWLIYELNGDQFFKTQAERFTAGIDSVQYFTHTHDLGFMHRCSYGNGYRLTGNEAYKEALITGARSLATRYSDAVGCIRSWDMPPYNYPVIVDNMMNLELLTWASKATGESKFMEMALSHANNTIKNHYRPDNSSYHLVDYNPKNGKIIEKMTVQGYADESSWARGQAWGLYGFTMMYRETNREHYLEQAKKIAHFLMNHPRLPENKIPYWDFDTNHIPNDYRDASAAAIMASAFLELSTLTDNSEYFLLAETMLKNLSGSQYLAEVGQNNYFILKHSVGHLPGYSEIDVPINYADYYFLEALARYINMTKGKKND
ncbi:glycoside hydrolase family 88 protein [Marinoscillum sp. MHG1-6]|uniref:glycoside hydrolase family 88 protein n=1 Tax=Marinoscillum sp. MHG1-6 TaxID=2959627 RepID=UPI002157036A|nr:glycoside hydrolase family 88 protein [Marinoscillum sp. MHG1-6]